jgi:HAD superfamily hydrolase (TIGR01509 family)
MAGGIDPSAMAAVLFDMDGVLVDSERYWVEREREAILPATVAESVDPAEITGMNVADLYDYLDAEYDTLVGKDAFVAEYDEHATEIYRDQVSLLTGFETTVGLLRDRAVAVGLVSSSPVRWIDMVRDRFLLRDVFDVVVSADHVEHGKPAPDVYLEAASLLDCAPEECLAVEDSAHGLRAADRAGMRTIGYTGSDDDPPEALAGAEAVATSGEELRDVLLTRNGV